MATIDGQWDCEVDSPMGKQSMVLTLSSSGGTFSGAATGPLGAVEVSDGQVIGEQVTFKLAVKVPMPMELECEARLTGDDTIEGSVDTGAFGKFPMRATRKG
jgi:hypothetical protein